ncbi:MAG: hypothetical protein OXC81_06785 [Betaproteobacteria bacterium]|nr:hypothetical protein [Betaproteobacteria bacterium]
MTVNDLSNRVRARPSPVRWLLVSFAFFTLGVAAAATLFAYTSRIPIPLKENPTRSSDAQIVVRARQNQPAAEVAEPEISFRETLRRRSGGVLPESQAEPVPPPPEELAYYVIAGTFENEALAGERRELVAAGLEGQQVSVQVRSDPAAAADQRTHQVLIGSFATSEEADSVRGRLALLGLDTRIERLPVAAAQTVSAPEPASQSEPESVPQPEPADSEEAAIN